MRGSLFLSDDISGRSSDCFMVGDGREDSQSRRETTEKRSFQNDHLHPRRQDFFEGRMLSRFLASRNDVKTPTLLTIICVQKFSLTSHITWRAHVQYSQYLSYMMDPLTNEPKKRTRCVSYYVITATINKTGSVPPHGS